MAMVSISVLLIGYFWDIKIQLDKEVLKSREINKHTHSISVVSTTPHSQAEIF